MVIHCERDNCFQNTLVCIYRCSKKDKKRCREYLKHLEEIMAEGAPEKYLEKYGEPDFCVPKEPKKRQPKVETEVKPKKRIVRQIESKPEDNAKEPKPVELDGIKKRKKRSDTGKTKSRNTGKANIEIEPKKKRRERSDKGQKRGKRK